MFSSFDLRTIIMIIIGSGILAAMFLLTGVVLCLYSKIARALNPCGCAREIESCMDPTKAASEKMIRGKPIIADPCRPLQCCDNCSLFKDVGAMPPCFCGTNEGL